jgi:hypothetical protein
MRTTTRVFVRDFETGRLPPVSVVTGRPTFDLAPLRCQRKIRPGRAALSGRVPMERRVWRWARIRAGLGFGGIGVMAILVGVVPADRPDILYDGFWSLIATTGVLIGWLLIDRFRRVTVSLDRSRRWVEMTNVHVGFATAVAERGLNPESILSA